MDHNLICTIDSAGIIQEIGPGRECFDFLGYQSEELKGMHVSKVLNATGSHQFAAVLAESPLQATLNVECKDIMGEGVPTLWSLFYSPSEHFFFCTVHNVRQD